jgi:arylsulfatase A-like enzyme
MKNLQKGLLSLATLPGALMAQEATEINNFQSKSSQSRPNVVMIYADDLGFGDLGCYGAKGVKTPNVDRLAERGLRFTNAHAVASTSTPSRYALLTGQYPFRKTGTDVAAGDAAMIISPDQYTVADVFKDAGYTTAAFGKWHLGLGAETGKQDWNKPISPALPDIGFDYSYIMAATADRVPCVFIENSTVANYDPTAPIYVNYNKNFEGEPTGCDNPELLYNLKSSHGHDYSIVNGIGRIGYMKGGGKALWKDENIADSITSHAVEFIKENSKAPFFMYFATNDVHVPRFPHQRFRGTSEMGLRGDAIIQFDWSVGEIMRTLEEHGLMENTIIILTSDNGPVLDDGYQDQAEELVGEHSPTGGLRGGKYSAYEGGTRVPFIVHWPAAIKEAGTRDALLSQIDFLDVMASIVGVGKGKALSPDGQPEQESIWFGGEGEGRSYAIGMAQNHTLTLRTPHWKFIEPKGGATMIPWGPKIETGYSTSPQLFQRVNGEYDETTNKATEYPSVNDSIATELEKIRKTATNSAKFHGAYHIKYNGKPVFIGYNTTHDRHNSEGYKIISPDHYSSQSAGDEVMIIRPSEVGHTLSMQGKFLNEPRLSQWGHIMFSDNEAEAGKYLIEETSTQDVYKIRSTSDGINYVNIYTEHGVAGNDKASKAELASYTIEELYTFPFSIPAENMASICLPFNVIIPEGACAYDLTIEGIKFDAENGTYSCNLTPIAISGETLKGGTPAIIGAEQGYYTLTITMKDSNAKGAHEQSLLKGNFVAERLSQDGDATKYLLTLQNGTSGFKSFRGIMDIAANQCWMEWKKSGVEELSIVPPTPTGIENTFSEAQDKKPNSIYNIAGQRMKSPQQGINIMEGKKFIVE